MKLINLKHLQLATVALVLSIIPANIHARESVPTPPGQYAHFFAGGSGTPDDPYLITTAEHFNNLRHAHAEFFDSDTLVYYRLENDIDIATFSFETWGKMGWEPLPGFCSKLDGNGHQVTGLWINWTDYWDKQGKDYAGLFLAIGHGGEIRNLGVVTDHARGGVKGCRFVGGLAGSISNGRVLNCHVTGEIAGYGFFLNNVVGGLAGKASSNCIITGCSVHGNVGLVPIIYEGDTIGGGIVGGLVGEVTGARRMNEVIFDPITGNPSEVFDEEFFLFGKVTITKCYTACNINTPFSSGLKGGLVGILGDGAEIIDCYATGDVFGFGSTIGGLVGEAYGITAITNCYASGSIGHESLTHWESPVVGRLRLKPVTDLPELLAPVSRITIANCYFRQDPGGINSWMPYGHYDFTWLIEWNKEEWGIDYLPGIYEGEGVGRTTAAMQTQAAFPGFDFETVWAMDEGSGFPYLRSTYETSTRSGGDPQSIPEEKNSRSVYGTTGAIVIQTDTPVTVRIYTTTGQLVRVASVGAGVGQIPVAKGFYIVSAGNGSYKVAAD
ncbi:MAG: hypothetical protein LBJ23_02265 [Tannerella sp.]|nr:hypothetical protein [Tannerella sp.]